MIELITTYPPLLAHESLALIDRAQTVFTFYAVYSMFAVGFGKWDVFITQVVSLSRGTTNASPLSSWRVRAG